MSRHVAYRFMERRSVPCASNPLIGVGSSGILTVPSHHRYSWNLLLQDIRWHQVSTPLELTEVSAQPLNCTLTTPVVSAQLRRKAQNCALSKKESTTKTYGDKNCLQET
eukprot:TRINITY_DN9850_c0_g1_i1.p1 TRINITY_DN9850_c0_g1~~TRINITY_DN9850_c0_g1_i1.p1  ORF type:complete len:109 (-),score=5.03 TRINITY_DN9850_c0_g1_i1:109-435(-)